MLRRLTFGSAVDYQTMMVVRRSVLGLEFRTACIDGVPCRHDHSGHTWQTHHMSHCIFGWPQSFTNFLQHRESSSTAVKHPVLRRRLLHRLLVSTSRSAVPTTLRGDLWSGKKPKRLYRGSEQEIVKELKAWVERRKAHKNVNMDVSWNVRPSQPRPQSEKRAAS